MTRRSKAGGKPVKTRRRKTVTPTRPNAAKVVRGRGFSIADLQEQLGSGLIDHSQKMTVAAIQIADKNV